MEQRKQIFVTKLKQFKTKNGDPFLVGNIGVASVILFKHKTNEDEWNLFFQEKLQNNKGEKNESRNESDEIPF